MPVRLYEPLVPLPAPFPPMSLAEPPVPVFPATIVSVSAAFALPYCPL